MTDPAPPSPPDVNSPEHPLYVDPTIPKVNDGGVKTFRLQLMERGVYPQYLAHLRELKGMMSAAKAKRIALEKFLGKDFVMQGMSAAQENSDFDGEEEGSGASRSSPRPKYVNMKMFEGKECTEIEAIRWVASVIGMFGVKARDCPSAMAWNLMNQCRADADFVKTFWSSMFTKVIPAKSQRVDGVGEEVDGEEQIDLCDRLLAMREESKNG